jgi:hypothetical protein
MALHAGNGKGVGHANRMANALYPSLSLNFLTTTTLDPRITFARASSATYTNAAGLLATAASGVPRFDYSPTSIGTPLGLLLEGQATNLNPRGTIIGGTGWGSIGTTGLTTNNPAPDGTSTAYAWSSAASDQGFYISSIPVLPNTTYVMSYYVKQNSGSGSVRVGSDQAKWGAGNGYALALFNPATKAFSFIDTAVSAYGWAYAPNGFIRVWVAATTNSVTTSVAQIAYTQSGTTQNSTFWGAQIETGGTATSFIPTAGSSATRAADSPIITGANFSSWFNRTQGTMVAQYMPSAIVAPSIVWGMTDGGGTNVHRILPYVGGLYGKTVAGANTGEVLGTQPSNNVVVKSAWAFQSGSFALASNGALSGTASNVFTMPLVTQAVIGDPGGSAGVTTFNGWIQAVSFYPLRLPNSQLQQLTQ